MRKLFFLVAVSGMWASVGGAEESASEDILPAMQDAYGRGVECVASHEFDGSEPTRPASTFCDGVIDEMQALQTTRAYQLLERRDRSCFGHMYNAFWGNYEIKRLEAGGPPGQYGRTPGEAEAMILSDEHQIGALNCMGS